MIGAVKLVDAAGTLRLDLNGHRVHFNREQGLDLLIQLGAGLEVVDIGDGARFACESYADDVIAINAVGSRVQFIMEDADTQSVHLSKARAIQAAVAILSMVSELPE